MKLACIYFCKYFGNILAEKCPINGSTNSEEPFSRISAQKLEPHYAMGRP